MDHVEVHAGEGALRIELAKLVRSLHARGWMPATSSNFSARLSSACLLISESGIDKELFGPEHLLRVGLDGSREHGETRRASAEALLHAVIYRFEDAGVVLHTHSVHATVCSRLFASAAALTLEGYELLKAFPDILTHDVRVSVPVLANSQDMAKLSAEVAALLTRERTGPRCPGFLIAGHGLYAWGRKLSDAKRHVEAFESLFECELKLAQTPPIPRRQA